MCPSVGSAVCTSTGEVGRGSIKVMGPSAVPCRLLGYWKLTTPCGSSLIIIAVRPPSISASSTMGGATLLGTCLTGLQGLRGPLGWEPAEAPGTNNVVSKAAGVDIAYREPVPTTTVRRYDESSQGAREPAAKEPADTTTARRRNVAPTEPEKTTLRRHFYHVLSLTLQL